MPILRLVALLLVALAAHGQVKPSFLYNQNTPFGELDIRTRIASDHYYYLQENVTFSHRQNASGQRLTSYLDMTDWDSSPFKHGNLRIKHGNQDKFVMNYRLLQPQGYSPTLEGGYPLLVFFHGAVERGNCYYNDCYHANSLYDPNENIPSAPTERDSKLLNNDDHLNIGGPEFIAAINAATGYLPGDDNLPDKAFPGFVLMAQMMNIWDSLNVQDVIRIVQLHCEKYNIDQDRVYVQGLSIGGYAVYEAIKRAPWLFAAAIPMSAVTEAANIFKHKQENAVSHIPLWVFQGMLDKNPSPEFTDNIVSKFKNAGAQYTYTKYDNVGHRVWPRVLNNADVYRWMQKQAKNNLHVKHGKKKIDKKKNFYPTLQLADGFLSYQWEKDGVVLSNATASALQITAPGKYRARFSRLSATPSASQWNEWSAYVTIEEITEDDEDEDEDDDNSDNDDDENNDPDVVTSVSKHGDATIAIYPNPSTGNSTQLFISTTRRYSVTIYNSLGQPVKKLDVEKSNNPVSLSLVPGAYYIIATDGLEEVVRRLIVN